MIVYRDQSRAVLTAQSIAAMRRKLWAPDHESARDLLIEFGQFECGIADLAAPDDSRLAELRRIAVLIGRMFYRSSKQLSLPPLPEQIACAFSRFACTHLPETIEFRTPEGYWFYGLFPETYIAAAEEFFSEFHPAGAVVLGIRSIGTSLSAVVGGTLAELGVRVESWTVRPQGHPFDRVAGLPPMPSLNVPHVIVDEGPGLSGSSFASVAHALNEAGIPASQIIFFPSWRPNPDALLSEKARDRWKRHRAFTSPFEPEIVQSGLREWHDLSAGEWRRAFLDNESEFPPVQPQHERRKFLSKTTPRVLAKFAGFGDRGRAALERSQALHDAGFVPPPIELAHGFFFSRFVPGEAARQLNLGLMCTIVQYLAHISREFPSTAGPQDLLQMTTFNVSRALGYDWTPSRDFLEPLADARPCLLDARMLPHEWIETSRGFLKTDAADHADDHFFPGPQDIAWDVAGAAVEFSLADPAELLERFASLSGDRDIHRRFPFYALAYSAFRMGYCELAQTSVAGSERDRFAAAARRYRAAVHRYTCPPPR